MTRHAGLALVRLPWMLLGFADPSSHTIFEIRNGSVSMAHVQCLGVDVVLRAGRLLSARPIPWPGWNSVSFTERRKASWPILLRAFHRATH